MDKAYITWKIRSRLKGAEQMATQTLSSRCCKRAQRTGVKEYMRRLNLYIFAPGFLISKFILQSYPQSMRFLVAIIATTQAISFTICRDQTDYDHLGGKSTDILYVH